MSEALRVLYVDDDDDIRTIASMALKLDPGIDLRTASSGQDAIALLDDTDWTPDVVLLDVMMPGMNGFSLLEKLKVRGDTGGARAIFMTARASRAGLEEYTASGAHGVILKPFDPLGLAQEVRTIVAQAKDAEG